MRIKPNILLAASLKKLKAIEKNGVVQSSDLNRTDRERLVANGFLREIINGWLMISTPQTQPGDSIPWNMAYWSFISRYLNKRFGDNYCLSPVDSIKIHTSSTVIPSQLTVTTTASITQIVNLPFDNSIVIYSRNNLRDNNANIVAKNNIRIYDLPYALSQITAPFFKNNPIEAEIALRMLRNPSPLIGALLESGKTVIAGEIAGAYKALGDEGKAEQIIQSMNLAGYKVVPKNPFNRDSFEIVNNKSNVYELRLNAMWNGMRQEVIDNFTPLNDMPVATKDIESKIKDINDIFIFDAYNSLSIEGYQVSEELIEKVRNGSWDSENNPKDMNTKNALAAKGYNLAFQAVITSIKNILSGADATEIIEKDHQNWWMQMFSPSVKAGILEAKNLMGYRDSQVFIKNACHVPPPKEALMDYMEAFFNKLKEEPNITVKAVLGHYFFVYIHPYMDGNGRSARFLMNTILVSGGYPWTVIKTEDRKRYLDALNEAQTTGKIANFAKFVNEQMLYKYNAVKPLPSGMGI